MKKPFLASAWVRAALGLLLAIGAQTFLGPCVHADGNIGTCHYAGQVLSGLGFVLTVQAIIALVCGNAKMREAVSLSMVPVAVLAALVPGTLVPLCMMATMRCNAIMKPAAIFLAALIALLSAADALVQHAHAKGGNKA